MLWTLVRFHHDFLVLYCYLLIFQIALGLEGFHIHAESSLFFFALSNSLETQRFHMHSGHSEFVFFLHFPQNSSGTWKGGFCIASAILHFSGPSQFPFEIGKVSDLFLEFRVLSLISWGGGGGSWGTWQGFTQAVLGYYSFLSDCKSCFGNWKGFQFSFGM